MKTILTFIGFYLPGYKAGGALRTIANMVDVLDDDINFKLITRDRDWGDNSPYKNIKVNEWNDAKNCKIYYLSKHNSFLFTRNQAQSTKNKLTNPQSLRTIINNTDFDTYYLNSLFDFSYSIKIILLRKLRLIPQKKVILAPRGEFMDGALKTRTLKKRVFIVLSKLLRLYKNVIWHASTESEAAEIKREMGMDISYKTALDVPDFSLLERKVNRREKEKGKLKILFISVIVPKKNLKFAIEVLNKVEGDFAFDIYGPIKDEQYWKECLDAISPKIKARVNYKGEVNNSDIHNIYPNYDLFFFPTLGENFGHVVWESLAFGCPVLTTNTTPWNGLEDFGAGWNFSIKDYGGIKEKIMELINTNENSYSLLGDGCVKYTNGFSKDKTLSDNICLFN